MIAFTGLVLTGLTLFIAEASHVVLNRVFQIKLGLIALGLANIVAFEVWVTPKVQKSSAAHAAAESGTADRACRRSRSGSASPPAGG